MLFHSVSLNVFKSLTVYFLPLLCMFVCISIFLSAGCLCLIVNEQFSASCLQLHEWNAWRQTAQFVEFVSQSVEGLTTEKGGFAFVSCSDTDVCSCSTNVTSHNTEKLHQSHLITHIHDAALHSAASTRRLQPTEQNDVAEWKDFQSTDSARLCHKHQLDTSMPIWYIIWGLYGERAPCFSLQSIIDPLPAASFAQVGLF